jgi:uncharacterized protein
MKKIIIAGGSGYLGSLLAEYFSDKAYTVVILSRSAVRQTNRIRHVAWNGVDEGVWTNELEGADMLINLSGKNVNCRYSQKNKDEIYRSRLASTHVLGEAVINCKNPPKVWINASSATIYVGSSDQLMTEATGVIGNDFSMDVCKQWEAMFNKFKTPRTRKVVARISIVLGQRGGALPPLTNLVKYKFGGSQGNGDQFMSWIHERDFCRAIDWLHKNEGASGIYNLTSPRPIPNRIFMHQLRNALKTKWGISLSRTLLEIGAVLIRTETELILKSRKVYPQRLLNEGFVFEFSDTKEALEDLCSVEPRRN